MILWFEDNDGFFDQPVFKYPCLTYCVDYDRQNFEALIERVEGDTGGDKYLKFCHAQTLRALNHEIEQKIAAVAAKLFNKDVIDLTPSLLLHRIAVLQKCPNLTLLSTEAIFPVLRLCLNIGAISFKDLYL
jgi:hypothetical protein